AFLAAPVVRNENRIGTDRLDHLCSEHAIAAPRFDDDPITVGDLQPLGQARMNFNARLRIMIHERADTPRLRAGKKLAYHASGGENNWIFGIDLLRGRSVASETEARFAVGKIKPAVTLSDRIPRTWLEQPRRAGMIFVRAGPEHAVLA